MSINKKRLLVTAGIVVVAVVVAYIGYSLAHSGLNKPDTTVKPPTPTYSNPPTPTVTHPIASKVFTDVNNERVKAGVPALIEDSRLDASAAAKCNDMVTRDYFAHQDPTTGAEPWHFIVGQGVSYRFAGENLLYGYDNSDNAVKGWMNSPGHRANILNPNYSYEGLAVCHSDNYIGNGSEDIVVQHFVGL